MARLGGLQPGAILKSRVVVNPVVFIYYYSWIALSPSVCQGIGPRVLLQIENPLGVVQDYIIHHIIEYTEVLDII